MRNKLIERVQRAIDHIDCASELYTNDHDLIASVKAILTAALAAYDTDDRINEWQPIETAPKDGDYVLLYCPEDADGGGSGIVRAFRGNGDNWFEFDWAGNPVAYPPTHWMPLPEPPALKGDA